MAALLRTLPEYSAPKDGVLTPEMVSDFEDAGVLILRAYASPASCIALKDHVAKMIDVFDPGAHRSVFSTTSNAQLSDDYFVRSGGDIGYFFEEGVFDDAGNLTVDKINSLNKLGHAMHDLDPVFGNFSRTSALANSVSSLGIADPKIVQSMYIFKPPGVGGEVVCHQDSTYIYTEPESCIGFWFAIDDADLENGCMKFIPGAQKGPLRKINHRAASGGLVTETLDETPFPGEPLSACAKTGDLVIFHGRSPHQSAPNTSSRSRHAYTLHIVDGACEWPAKNWLQRSADLPFRGF